MSKLSIQLLNFAYQGGGAFKTVTDRAKIAARLADFLRESNLNIEEVDHLKIKHLEAYVGHRLASGIAKRTIQNEVAAIKKILRVAGRKQLLDHERLTNQALGLSGASRKGTKEPIPEEYYDAALAAAEVRDRGVAACLKLSRCLGLRAEEAVQSMKSLKTWSRVIAEGGDTLRIIFGTKGGRVRDTRVHNRAAIIEAVHYALDVAKVRRGKLIDKGNLKQAMNYFNNEVRVIGLTGKYSPHSLRYAYTVDAIRHYRLQGYSYREANALASIDLGHGDGRGRFVVSVYG